MEGQNDLPEKKIYLSKGLMCSIAGGSANNYILSDLIRLFPGK